MDFEQSRMVGSLAAAESESRRLHDEVGRLRGALAAMNAVSDHQTNRSMPPFRIGDVEFRAGVHPLTCGRDSGHTPLFPYWDGSTVSLRCPDCDYEQANPSFTGGDGRP